MKESSSDIQNMYIVYSSGRKSRGRKFLKLVFFHNFFLFLATFDKLKNNVFNQRFACTMRKWEIQYVDYGSAIKVAICHRHVKQNINQFNVLILIFCLHKWHRWHLDTVYFVFICWTSRKKRNSDQWNLYRCEFFSWISVLQKWK